MRLLLDQGNSFLKWAIRDGDRWQTGSVNRRDDQHFWQAMTEAFPRLPGAEQILLSSVASKSDTDRLLEWLQDRFKARPALFRSTINCCGVTNNYTIPEALGSDRWAALIAARHRYRTPACVVDCGTAITVDLLDAAGVFRGGVIFPGLTMARNSLAAGTAGLNAESTDDIDCLARSTASAIASGTLLGVIGGIKSLVECQSRKLGSGVSVYLTGGDSELIADKLEMPCVVIGDLVLQGLDVVAEQRA